MEWIPRLTRRRFLAGAALATFGAGLYTWWIEPHWVEFVERSLPIANLPETWAGRTLVQVSDMHVGPVVDSDYLAASLAAIAPLEPDLVALTGDFMTCDGSEHLDEALRVVERLRLGRRGTFAVLGNHDYGEGWQRTGLAERLSARLEDIGVRVLRNQFAVVEGLRIVGLDDLWGPNFLPSGVLAQVNWREPTLTLCHNPDAVDLPSLACVRGWVLSGHTHGGQCKPPFLPPPLLPVKNARYTAGAFDIGEGRNLYINRGLGYLRRVRFNVRPEITVFRMERV